MREALYGERGSLVTLKDFIRLQNGETNPKKWTAQPFCPCCGEAVHAHDVNGALGFNLAGREVTKRKPRAQPGFHHYDNNPNPDCPLYFSNDPKFAGLAKHSFDVRARERVEKALGETEELNREAYFRLMTILTKKAVSEDDWAHMKKVMQRKSLLNMEVLADHPWLLPYLLVTIQKDQERISLETHKPYKVAFDARDEQNLVFRDFKGREREAKIPGHLQLCFVNRGRNREIIRIPMSWGKTKFTVSRASAYALAGLPLPKPPQQEKAPQPKKSYQMRLFPNAPGADPLHGPL